MKTETDLKKVRNPDEDNSPSKWHMFPETAKDVTSLADHIGKSRRRISQYRQGYPDAPESLGKKGTKESIWEWLDFLEKRGFLEDDFYVIHGILPDDFENDVEIISWRREREKWLAKREKLRYEKEAGKLGDIADISQRIQSTARRFINDLTKLLYSDLPLELEGKSAREIARIIKERTQDFTHSFADREQEVIEQKCD